MFSRALWIAASVVPAAVLSAPSTSIKRAGAASPFGPVKRVLNATTADGTISLVENSGVCETTPGVNTYSGYVNTNNDTAHSWFWFFEARENVSLCKRSRQLEIPPLRTRLSLYLADRAYIPA